MPPHVQQQIVTALAEVHRGTARYPWPPAYRVTAVRWRPIGELVEDELREIGVDASLDTDGELVHRDGTGRRFKSMVLGSIRLQLFGLGLVGAGTVLLSLAGFVA
jgi:hypothetical protein